MDATIYIERLKAEGRKENKRDELVIQYKLLSSDGVLPTKAHDTDAGYDLYSAMDCLLKPGEIASIKTDLTLSIPAGWYAEIKPRSGLVMSHGIKAITGVIDSGYMGEIKISLLNLSCNSYQVDERQRIAQLVFLPVPKVVFVEVDQHQKTERGTNGFGSSGY